MWIVFCRLLAVFQDKLFHELFWRRLERLHAFLTVLKFCYLQTFCCINYQLFKQLNLLLMIAASIRFSTDSFRFQVHKWVQLFTYTAFRKKITLAYFFAYFNLKSDSAYKKLVAMYTVSGCQGTLIWEVD